MQFDITSFVLGILLGSLLAVAIARPQTGRLVGGVAGVIAVAIGIGFVVWAGLCDLRGETLRPPFGTTVITELSEAYAWGAAFLVGGLVAIALVWEKKPKQKRRDVPEPLEPAGQ